MMTILDIAWKFFGVPYKFGGNSLVGGMDCSGFVAEVLRSKGIIGHSDFSAQDLYNKFNGINRSQLAPGSLLFFGQSRGSISHVAIAINDLEMLEAGGGDSSTIELDDAIRRNAYVRVRPIKYRSDLVAVLKVD